MIINQEELSIYDVESLHQALYQEFSGDALIIDMTNVKKVDMSIIQLLVAAKRSCEEVAKSFELKGVTPEALEIFKTAAVEYLLKDLV